MSEYRVSLCKGCMVTVLVLLLLTVFCLVNGEPGSAPFWLCIFSLVVDVPFLGFLLFQLIRDCRKIRRPEQSKDPSPARDCNQTKGGNPT